MQNSVILNTKIDGKGTLKHGYNFGEGGSIVHFDSSKTLVFSVWKIKMKKYNLPQ